MGTMPSLAAMPSVQVFSLDNPTAQAAPAVAPTPAALVTNPTSVVQAVTAAKQYSVPAGMFLADGFIPLPMRLVQRILALEFVEMADLLPEAWLSEVTEPEGASGKCCGASILPKRRRAPVTDILTWAQCFASLVGVLSTRYPQHVPSLMAYQAIIIKSSRDFEGIGWVQYDRAYRRQAAMTKELQWAKINTTLYSVCFAGKAKVQSLCTFCLGTSHNAASCPEAGQFMPWWQGWSPPMSQTTSTDPMPPRPSINQGGEICRLFNHPAGPRCHYTNCRYQHSCSVCRGPHARSRCKRSMPQGFASKKPRMG